MERMTREDNVFLAKRNIVDSIWKEARIEGIDVTFPQIQEIYDGRAVAGLSVDDTLAINNLKHAWRFVLGTLDEPMDLGYLQQLNYEIGQGGIVRYAGDIRVKGVGVTGTSWRPEIPDAGFIEKRLSSIATTEEPLRRALEQFAFITRSQIFNDGNKRVAQLAANKTLISEGCGILAIPPEHKARFGELLIEYYLSGEPDALFGFLIDTSVENPGPLEPSRSFVPNSGRYTIKEITEEAKKASEASENARSHGRKGYDRSR